MVNIKSLFQCEIEDIVTKTLSQEFSKTENRISGALFQLAEFHPNLPQPRCDDADKIGG